MCSSGGSNDFHHFVCPFGYTKLIFSTVIDFDVLLQYMMLRAVPQSILLSYWFYMNVCHLLKFVIRQPWKRKEMRYVQWVIICWNGGGYCYLLCTVLCSPTNGKQSQSLQLKSMHNSVRRNVCILAKKKIIILKLRVQTHTICSRKKSNIW